MTPVTLVSLVRGDAPERRLLPLGCLALAAALRESGGEVDVVDTQFAPEEVFGDPDRLVDHLTAELPELAPIVGLSVLSDALPLAVALCRRLRERHPDKLLILGGPGASAVSRQLLGAFPWIDAVARDESDRTIVQLARSWPEEPLTAVAGLDVRVGDDVVSTPPHALVDDLDLLPRQDTTQLPPAAYAYYSTIASRGCPYRCRFCEIQTRQRRRHRARSPEHLTDELIHAHHELGVRFVAFQDDLFLFDRARVRQILDRLEAADARLEWACFARVDTVDAEWLAELRARGLNHVSYGVESGSDRLLKALRKGTTVRRALDTLAVSAAIVPTTAFFQWGFPDETLAEFFETVQAFHHAASLGVSCEAGQVVPLPGAPLTREAERLEFHPRYPFPRIVAPPPEGELLSMIRTHPDVFPAFYSFPTPQRDEKWRLARHAFVV